MYRGLYSDPVAKHLDEAGGKAGELAEIAADDMIRVDVKPERGG